MESAELRTPRTPHQTYSAILAFLIVNTHQTVNKITLYPEQPKYKKVRRMIENSEDD